MREGMQTARLLNRGPHPHPAWEPRRLDAYRSLCQSEVARRAILCPLPPNQPGSSAARLTCPHYPDLVVVYLGMRVNRLTGLKTLIGFGPRISKSVEAQPDGLLRHENFVFSLFPMHAGMRQYWRDMDALLAWTRSDPAPPVVEELSARFRRHRLLA